MLATTTNAENLRQYESRFSLIVEQILAFASSTNLVREVKTVLKLQTNSITVLYNLDNSHLDR